MLYLLQLLKPVSANIHGCAPSRYWLIKGVRAITCDPLLFAEEGHSLKLGLSQSLAQSLKFWCLAFKLIEPQDQAQTYFTTTPFAQQLLGETGSDPYLEDAASLWILQWKLIESPCLLPVWRWFFLQFYRVEFTEPHLEKEAADVFRFTPVYLNSQPLLFWESVGEIYHREKVWEWIGLMFPHRHAIDIMNFNEWLTEQIAESKKAAQKSKRARGEN